MEEKQRIHNKIILQTSFTSLESIYNLLDAVRKNQPVTSEEGRSTVFPMARARIAQERGGEWSPEKRDTHAELTLRELRLVKDGETDNCFVVSDIGYRFLDAFKLVEIPAENNKVKLSLEDNLELNEKNQLLLDILCGVYVTNTKYGRKIRPYLLLFKLLTEPELDGFITRSEWAFVINSSEHILDTQYDEIKEKVIEIRKNHQTYEPQKSDRILTRLVLWGVLSKIQIDEINEPCFEFNADFAEVVNLNMLKGKATSTGETTSLTDIEISVENDDVDVDIVDIQKMNFESKLVCDLPRNRILFGAPGTGKSHTLNEETEKLKKDMNGEYERVTFHPDYSYANFVGTYKPVPSADGITYKYVPGPFMRVLKKALENANNPDATPRPFVLVIEEINRANVAAVFGDVFQLLDRDGSNCSEYKIEASEDLKKHLAGELHCSMEAVSELKIPNNMFIWATMNSADQGVFPMDTAFKRRWDFTYLGIDNGDEKIAGKTVTLGKGDYKRVIEWNKLRKAINGVLSSKDFKINEDKLMGPYFLSTKVIPLKGEIDEKKFTDAFKSKVIMYLFEDAAKQKKHTLFRGCSDTTRYSSIRDEFDTKGVFIFCEEIHNQFPATENGEGETE